MRQSWETMTSISAGQIILTPIQPVGSGRPQRGSNLGPPDQESRAPPTELQKQEQEQNQEQEQEEEQQEQQEQEEQEKEEQ